MMMDRLMPPCREVTDGLAGGDYEDAAWPKRALLRLHLAMCVHCARFARQLGLIAAALRAGWPRRPSAERVSALERRILGGRP